MNVTLRSFRWLATALLVLLLAACGGPGTQSNLRDTTLFAYAGAIRWGHIDDALGMVDPEYLKAHPLTALERERYEQVEFTGYLVKGSQMLSENELLQLVEIRLVNRHTLVERVIQDRQHWRWDGEARRWWLTTGLPDIRLPSR